ncbi:hypothetical protein WJX73_003125 [Symbiochloris irregularis]|uniref:Fe2OG dioxygenase domain-containing protein n=1 Tax=Symbiochloris irregularis TaxID=706552 RepID=A0AAW1PAC6_9CHLO
MGGADAVAPSVHEAYSAFKVSEKAFRKRGTTPTSAQPATLDLLQPNLYTGASCLRTCPTILALDSRPGFYALSARQLLRKLRWATLGAPYDWTARTYDHSAQQRPIPAVLHAIATRLMSMVAQLHHDGSAESAMAPFVADAAIVNYYGKSDTLGGHRDDVESDLTQPLISISLGCSAIFLLGGHTKDVDPVPIILRSGDAIVLMGSARTCYHGMPRLLDGQPCASSD